MRYIKPEALRGAAKTIRDYQADPYHVHPEGGELRPVDSSLLTGYKPKKPLDKLLAANFRRDLTNVTVTKKSDYRSPGDLFGQLEYVNDDGTNLSWESNGGSLDHATGTLNESPSQPSGIGLPFNRSVEDTLGTSYVRNLKSGKRAYSAMTDELSRTANGLAKMADTAEKSEGKSVADIFGAVDDQ